MTAQVGWRRTLGCYAVAAIVIAAAAAMLIVGLDPYDTGRFALVGGGHGVPIANQRLTAASVGRSPEAQAVVIGNSTSQAIEPARLAAATGLRFVSLAIPATGPIEQLTVAHWVMRHHPALKALVFGFDNGWCRGDGRLEVTTPFPFWLYADSDLEYLRHLLNLSGLLAAERKVKLLLGIEPRTRADGYRYYEIPHSWTPAARDADLALGIAGYDAPGDDFAAAARLRALLPDVPKETLVMLLFLPRYASSLPPPGTEAARQEEACKAVFRAVAATRPQTIVVDLLRDDPMVRDKESFWDRVHFKEPVARAVEAAIAAAVKSARLSAAS